MSDSIWFRVEDVGTAKHTAETRKIQGMLEGLSHDKRISFNQFGKLAIIHMAQGLGYLKRDTESEAEQAFSFLAKQLWPLGTTKSELLRQAIIDFAVEYTS